MEPEPVNQPPEGGSGQVDAGTQGGGKEQWVAPVPVKRGGREHLKAVPNPDAAIDPSHPYAKILRTLTNLARMITIQLNKEPEGSLLKDYLASLGFAIARDIIVVTEDGAKHFGWKFRPFRHLYRAVKYAALRNRMTVAQLRKKLEYEEKLADRRAAKYGNRARPPQDTEGQG